MRRREFLQAIGLTTAASVPLLPLLSGCGTTGLTSYVLTTRNNRVVLNLSDYFELAGIGGAVEIDVEGHSDPIVVLRKSETEFLALSPVCTHLGCTVRKEPSVFRCPCHGSTYALDGTVVRGPAERSLTTYKTEHTQESLTIYL